MANVIKDGMSYGNPLVLVQSDSETWITRGRSITIKQAILEDVSADITSACVFSQSDGSTTATLLAHRDTRSGINTVIWPEPITVSNLYLQSLVAGRVVMFLE